MMKNEKGLMAIAIAAGIAALSTILILLSSSQFTRFTKAYRNAEGRRFANEIAINLGIQLRAAYDLGMRHNPSIVGQNTCPSEKFKTLGNIRLCMPTGVICTRHPLSPTVNICISVDNGTITASNLFLQPKMELFKQLFGGERAFAQDRFRPPVAVLPGGVPSISLSAAVGADLGPDPITCGTGAPGSNTHHCLTFTFCPLTVACTNASQMVTQTIAFASQPIVIGQAFSGATPYVAVSPPGGGVIPPGGGGVVPPSGGVTPPFVPPGGGIPGGGGGGGGVGGGGSGAGFTN
jgi:hypothetical protein